jgi:hypothetical protein
MHNRQRSASSESARARVVANNTISGRIDVASDRLGRAAGERQLGVKSMIRYSVAGVSRVARQVSLASGRRTASTRTLTIRC